MNVEINLWFQELLLDHAHEMATDLAHEKYRAECTLSYADEPCYQEFRFEVRSIKGQSNQWEYREPIAISIKEVLKDFLKD